MNCSVCGLPVDRPEIKPRYPGDTKKGSAKGMCRPCYGRAYKAAYYEQPGKRENRRVQSAAYHQANKTERNEKIRANYAAVKAEVMTMLGGHCQCCGETRAPFLTIDHIGGGGREHYRRMNNSHKRMLYDIRREGCPRSKYRVLCWNCNAAIGLFGVCPHASS